MEQKDPKKFNLRTQTVNETDLYVITASTTLIYSKMNSNTITQCVSYFYLEDIFW